MKIKSLFTLPFFSSFFWDVKEKNLKKKILLTLFHIIAINSNQHKKDAKVSQVYSSVCRRTNWNVMHLIYILMKVLTWQLVLWIVAQSWHSYWHHSSLLLDQEKHISCEKSRWIKCNKKYSQCPFFSEVNISVVFVAILSYHIHILQLLFWLSFDNWNSGPEIFNLEKRVHFFVDF